MKAILIAVFSILLFSTESLSQKAFYFLSCYMDGDQLNVGRAKVFSNVFKAGPDTAKKQLIDQYWDFLNKEKPAAPIYEYFRYKDVATWGEAAVKNVHVFGPYSYLEATKMLRKQIRSTKSRDWLALTVDGFGYFPNKFKVVANEDGESKK